MGVPGTRLGRALGGSVPPFTPPRPFARRPRAVVGTALVAGGIALLAGPASAHVSPTPSEVPAGAYTNVQLLVPHGCDGSATEKVEVLVPEQIITASPYWIAGWTAEATTEDLAEPVDDGHGGELTERTAQLTWTAGEGDALPDGQYLDFGVGFKAPDAEGETLYFKTIQTCEDGTAEWITEWDGEGEEPDAPAPAVKIVAGTGDGHGGEAAADDHGDAGADDEGEAASSDSADGGSDSDSGSDSSTPVAVAGLVAGLGGLVLGGTALAKARKA